ncbi:MAG: response regulator [Nitrospirota bacterium]
MVVICPKCKTKLKVAEEKLTPEGSRFKCPKCSTFLLVKKPTAPMDKKTETRSTKILIAHSEPKIINELNTLLTKNGYQTVIASDGIEAMVKSIKEVPFLAILDVALPKIYGFEVCKRLKVRDETKKMKIILITSTFDEKRYKRDPSSIYGADDYIEEHKISELIIEKINTLKGIEKEKVVEKAPEEPILEKPVLKEEPRLKPEEVKVSPPTDQNIERAKRLARTIVSDIYLYNPAKVENSIRGDNFYSMFESEIKEGLKLYETRIPQNVREKGDFFNEAIKNFLDDKKKSL